MSRGRKYIPQQEMRDEVRRLLEAAPKSVLIDTIVDQLATLAGATIPANLITEDEVKKALEPHYAARKDAIKKRRAEQDGNA